jgi:hypothetical protein
MKVDSKKNKKQESGQIIVLLAISLLVLVIVSALAVDGGMIYSERRFAQNAADSASLAGGGAVLNYMEELTGGVRNVTYSTFSCSNTLINMAKDNAIFLAGNNNFTIPYLGKIVNGTEYPETNTATGQKYDLNANHGVVIICDSAERKIYTQVRITSSVSTAFAHLIFPEDLKTTNEAVTVAEPRRNRAKGNGIVSLSEACKNNTDGMEFVGTGIVNVIGGSVHSNSCLTASGNVNVIATDGTIKLVKSSATINGGATLTPSATGGVGLMEIDEMDIPACTVNGKILGNEYQPGIYPSGIKITNGTWTFKSGIYCLNGDLEITGGKVTGYGVTFVMNEGNVKITGNADVILTASFGTGIEDVDGTLFYMVPSNPGLITMIGTDRSRFTGTVFAPTGNIEAGGTSDGVSLDLDGCLGEPGCTAGNFNVQLIGWYVKIVGTSEIDVIYDESALNFIVGQMYLVR